MKTKTILFDDTVKANIAYGLDGISDKEIEDAAKAANADEFIRELPDGYSTIIVERGVSLSGGQKQRVAIARALSDRPKLLLADEPTSALDSVTGREIVSLLKRLAIEQNCSVLMVTHDPRILDVADRLLKMEDGKILPIVG